MTIKKVLICGLGALGLTYANKLRDVCELKILVDKKRLQRLTEFPPIFNDVEQKFDYILPDSTFDADLIIIATKSLGLDDAIKFIKNFVSEKTIIISMINGISSEEKISSVYGRDKVVRSYFIGHSAMGFSVAGQTKYYQDGVGKIVLEKNDLLENFFTKINIDFEVSDNILASMWLKLGVNIVLNQLSALNNMTVGELREQNWFSTLAKNLLDEVSLVAKKLAIIGLEDYEKKVLELTYLIAGDGKTSMLQDIIAKRKTEVDIFSGEIIRLGEELGVETPCNNEIYGKIKALEAEF